MRNINKILVATDFSPDSRTALDEAVALGEKFKSTVYVLHAVDTIQECAVDYCLTDGQIEATKGKLLGEAKRKLDEELARYKNRKDVALVADLRYGHTYDEILKEESEKHIDLLVVGPHPKKTVWQRLSRHLVDRLANNSTCDTLVVRHAGV